MTPVYKALSALLAYPSAELVAALPEVAAILGRERGLPPAQRAALAALVSRLAATDLIDLQEAYVALFDRGRATSLHLFEHVHGDSRERGQAMVDLKAVYARAGFALAGGELPDFLPAVLEYLAQRPAAEAREMLGDCAHILRAVGEALAAREADYAAVFAALLALAGEPGFEPKPRPKAAAKEPSLDDEWTEAPVIFGPAAAQGCGAAPPATAVMQFVPRRA